MGEEAGSLLCGLACGLPGRFEKIEDGMPGEGEQVKCGQRHRQKRFAVAEIVFEFVAVIFHHVEGLVLDLPARPAASDDFGHVIFVHRQAGHPGHGIFDAALGIDNLETDPVDQSGILAVAQRNALDPAITARFERLALANFFLVALGFGAGDEIVERLVRAFLAGEYEIIARGRQHFDDRLAGKEIVAEIDGAQGAKPVAVLAVPALDGVAFAVLFFRTVLRRDELGKQRDDFRMAGGDASIV
jgi:hypothetical protein